MSLLTDAIAKLESGGSSYQGAAAGGYVNYRYQQFPGFVNQYGFGETGINNYASQVLAANPNATFGDLYGGYVTGTGTPANASMESLLTTTQPGAQGAYSNLMNNSIIPPNTPLSSLLDGSYGSTNSSGSIWSGGSSAIPYGSSSDYFGAGGNLGTSSQDYGLYGSGVDLGSSSGFPGDTSQLPYTPSGAGTYDAGNLGSYLGGGLPSGGGSNPFLGGSGIGGSGPLSLLTGAFGAASGLAGTMGGPNSAGSGDPTFFAWLGDWALRGAVIILGFVFVIAGLYMLKGNIAVLKDAEAFA